MRGALIVFVIFGGVGFVGALAVAFALARSLRSAAAIAAVGPVVVIAILVFARLNPPDSPLHHEAEYLGIRLDPLVWVTLAFNLVGWLVGTAVGLVARSVRRRDAQAVRSS
jgi:uncharacterized membrane protein